MFPNKAHKHRQISEWHDKLKDTYYVSRHELDFTSIIQSLTLKQATAVLGLIAASHSDAYKEARKWQRDLIESNRPEFSLLIPKPVKRSHSELRELMRVVS